MAFVQLVAEAVKAFVQLVAEAVKAFGGPAVLRNV
jgi:hypothetical protein